MNTSDIKIEQGREGVSFHPLTENASKQVGCPVGQSVWMELKESLIYLKHLRANGWKVERS